MSEIRARKVYYRGPSFSHSLGIDYVNVEDYLLRIGRLKTFSVVKSVG